MKEAQHDPDKRERLKPPRAPKRFRPFRLIRNLVLFLFLVVLFLYGGLLLIVQTDGFNELISDAVQEATGVPVEIESVRLAADGQLSAENVIVKGGHPLAEVSAKKLKIVPDWELILERKQFAVSRVRIDGLLISVVELSDGTRAPAYVTDPLELTQWKVFVDPADVMDGSGHPPASAPAGGASGLTGMTAAVDSAEFPPKEDLPLPWWQDLGLYQIKLRDASVRILEESGNEKVVFQNLSYDYDPGDGKGERALQDPRHLVSGQYRFGPASVSLRELRFELLDQKGRWVFLNTEADHDLIMWLQQLDAGPIVAVREVELSTLVHPATVPPPAVPEPETSAPETFVIQVGTQILYQADSEMMKGLDPEALQDLVDQIIAEHQIALPAEAAPDS